MANSSAHPVRAGFEQAGAYFMALTPLEVITGAVGSQTTTALHVYKINVAGSNSGGAFVAPTFTQTTIGDVMRSGPLSGYTNLTDVEAAGLVGAGALLKDMGKTVVSAGRTFRKFQVVATGIASGVVGSAAASPNTGYASFYLDVTRNGVLDAAPAPILRYF